SISTVRGIPTWLGCVASSGSSPSRSRSSTTTGIRSPAGSRRSRSRAARPPCPARHPQILLKCAAAYPDQPDREQIMNNYLEEDGLVHPGDDPHYDLLQMLINKIAGDVALDPRAPRI